MPELGDSDLESLLKAIAKGDNKSMEEFYERTINKVFAFCLRVTHDESIAEEVVCDTYLQVWQHADNYDSARGDVVAWLMVLTRSRAFDTLRRNKQHKFHDQIDDELASETDTPEDLLEAIDQTEVMYKLVQQLDETQRQLVALAFFRGYTHSELAEFTGLPLGTIKSRLRRALQTLREQLMESGYEWNGESNV